MHFLYPFILLFLVLSPSSNAQDTPSLARPELEGRVEGNIRAGTERSIAMTEFWVPIAQSSHDGSVIYGDLRLMGDDQDNREFNVGVGYREMVNTALLNEGIIGVHVWYDRRLTERGSRFNQITGGMEWFGDIWDLKLNAYYPLNDDNTLTIENPSGAGSGFVGNQVIVNTDQTIIEEALPGVDAEIGVKLPIISDITDSTRFYIGGYHFDGDRSNNVTGWRTRFTSDVTSNVQIGARYQYDDVRGSQGFVEATIRLPFGSKQSYKKQGLYARLDESPERDIDIVSNEEIIEDGLNETLLNAQTGAIQNVIHVNNTAGGGGDGSFETPFNTLAAAEVAAGANDLIYVHRGDGTTAGQNTGIAINDDGQMLSGAGIPLTFSSQRFSTTNGNSITGQAVNMVVADPLGGPTITNGAGDGVAITADNVHVSGITVDGAANDGISITNANNVSIHSTNSINSTDHGIDADYTVAGNWDLDILNSNFSSNGIDGVDLLFSNTGKANVDIKNNVFNGNTDDGFLVDTNATSDIDLLLTVKNNQANNNTGAPESLGIASINSGTGTTRSFIQNNIVDGNGTIGIYQYTAVNNGRLITIIDSNTAKNNSRRGIAVQGLSGTGTVNTTITNNSTIDNGPAGTGIYVRAHGDTNVTATLDNNISLNNCCGILLVTQSNGALNAVVQNSTATNNTILGIQVLDNSTSILNADLGGGIFGSIGHNTLHSNTLFDATLDADGNAVSAQNNFWGNNQGIKLEKIFFSDGTTIIANEFLEMDPNN